MPDEEIVVPKIKLDSNITKIILTIVGWIASVVIAYTAMKSDVAVLKSQRDDDRTYYNQQIHDIKTLIDKIDIKLDRLDEPRNAH